MEVTAERCLSRKVPGCTLATAPTAGNERTTTRSAGDGLRRTSRTATERRPCSNDKDEIYDTKQIY